MAAAKQVDEGTGIHLTDLIELMISLVCLSRVHPVEHKCRRVPSTLFEVPRFQAFPEDVSTDQ